MTRDIKFRAWNKYNETMGEVTSLNKYQAQVNGFSTSSLEDLKLMQYTGLKDKNGIEIYEGDILKGFWLFNDDGVKVEWNNDSAMFSFNGWNFDVRRKPFLEVIGNIYENPELLEIKL